jgi:hypothetical protein
VKSKGIVTEFSPDTTGIVKVIRTDDVAGGLDDLASSGGIKTGAEGGAGRTMTVEQLKQEFPSAAVDIAVKQAALDTFTPAIQKISSQIGRGTTISRQVQIPFGGLQQAASAPVISDSNIFAGQQQTGQQARQQFITDFQGIQLPAPTQQEIQAVVNTRVPKVTGIGLTFDKPKVGELTVTKPGQVEAVVPSLSQSQQNKLRTLLRTKSPQRTETLVVESPREGVAEIPGTGTRTKLITDTPQRQKVGVPQVPKVPTFDIPIPKVPKAPVGLALPGNTFQDTKEKLDKLKGKAVNVVVGKGDRKKVVFRNLPPNRAMKKGLEHIKRTIRASFVLKPTGKVTKKKDIRFTRPNTQQFRPGKTNALRVVERQNLRLNTPKEKVQLAESRRRADKRRKRRGNLFGI